MVQKQRVVAEMRNMLADHEDRINSMCDHLKNVRQELALTQVELMFLKWLLFTLKSVKLKNVIC